MVVCGPSSCHTNCSLIALHLQLFINFHYFTYFHRTVKTVKLVKMVRITSMYYIGVRCKRGPTSAVEPSYTNHLHGYFPRLPFFPCHLNSIHPIAFFKMAELPLDAPRSPSGEGSYKKIPFFPLTIIRKKCILYMKHIYSIIV